MVPAPTTPAIVRSVATAAVSLTSQPVDVFTAVFGGLMAFFVVAVLLLGVFSKRSPREFLDWKPTRSPELEMENELDDVQQMIDAQNAMRRRRGAPEITEEDVREWRES
jgi:hypothetical protein